VRSRLARAWLLGCLLGAACEEKGLTPVVGDSAQLKTADARVAHLCDVTLCPSTPLDAAFLAGGDGEGSFVAVLRVAPADVHLWSRGCSAARLEARPPWLPPLLAQRGWKVTTAPETWRCGADERVIHVKEGIVARRVLPRR
jgi:hypothetical protein